MQSPEVTIAIESAVAGGSLSIFRGDTEIENWQGTLSVSKAEDLLFNIDQLLTSNRIDRREIGLIAVSAGPGSFTGIRIGIATGLGLKAGLNIPFASESVLKTMAFSAHVGGTVTVAIPVGRDTVCMQSLLRTDDALIPNNEPHTVTENGLAAAVRAENSGTFLVHEHLYDMVLESQNAVNFGSNLARSVGEYCRRFPEIAEPIFISKSF